MSDTSESVGAALRLLTRRPAEVVILNYAGVRGGFPLTAATVLVGQNDAGKTNVLDALGTAAGGGDPVRDGRRGGRDRFLMDYNSYVEAATVRYRLDLDDLADATLLARLVRAQLETGSRLDGRRPITLGSAYELRPAKSLESLSDIREHVVSSAVSVYHERVLGGDASAECLAHIGEYTNALRAVLAARWASLAVAGYGSGNGCRLIWCLPPADSLPADVVAWMDAEQLNGGLDAMPILGGYDLYAAWDTARPGDELQIGRILMLWLDRSPLTVIRPAEDATESRLLDLVEPHLTDHATWFSDAGDGLIQVNDTVMRRCEEISELATKLAPDFVSRDYEIVVTPGSAPLMNTGRRARIVLRPRVEREALALSAVYDAEVGLDAVGSGLRLWSAFAIEEALRRLRERVDSEAGHGDDKQPGGATTLYLFDEPERHLHPTAQVEAARFISRIAREGALVVTATHSPYFLELDVPDVTVVKIQRDQAGWTTPMPLPGGMAALEQAARDIGLNRADLILLTRGMLLVEGPQDVALITGFFGRELDTAFIKVISLRGAHEAIGLLDADVLRGLGVPIYVLLDNTSKRNLDAIQSGKLKQVPGAKFEHKELEILWKLRHELAASDNVHFVACELPDIVWAIPPSVVKARFPDFSSWPIARRLWVEQGRSNPKNVLKKAYKMSVDTRLIKDLVASSREQGLQPAPQLKSAIMTVIDGVSRGQRGHDAAA